MKLKEAKLLEVLNIQLDGELRDIIVQAIMKNNQSLMNIYMLEM